MIEMIQQIIQESVSGGFFKFVGYFLMVALILGVPARIIMFIISAPFRYMNIRKHGYPPQHCDADGDIKEKD